MEYIKELDKKIFFIINNDFARDYMDLPMVILSSRLTWTCCFAVALAIAIYLRRWRFVWVCGLLGLGFVVTDISVYYGLKPMFNRLRPCKEFPEMVRIVHGCAGTFGLPSNHAANGMVITALIFLARLPLLGLIALVAVLLVGFSRVYLGVHYPSDIFLGYVAGASIALIVFTLTRPLHGLIRAN
jgi:undecaprenyl-diphosphatase